MTILTATMIVGLLVIVALLVIRLAAPPPTLPELPAAIALPEGAKIAALTFAKDLIVVVTEAGGVLVYDKSGTLRQELAP